jgi:hypothetical protein
MSQWRVGRRGNCSRFSRLCMLVVPRYNACCVSMTRGAAIVEPASTALSSLPSPLHTECRIRCRRDRKELFKFFPKPAAPVGPPPPGSLRVVGIWFPCLRTPWLVRSIYTLPAPTTSPYGSRPLCLPLFHTASTVAEHRDPWWAPSRPLISSTSAINAPVNSRVFSLLPDCCSDIVRSELHLPCQAPAQCRWTPPGPHEEVPGHTGHDWRPDPGEFLIGIKAPPSSRVLPWLGISAMYSPVIFFTFVHWHRFIFRIAPVLPLRCVAWGRRQGRNRRFRYGRFKIESRPDESVPSDHRSDDGG